MAVGTWHRTQKSSDHQCGAEEENLCSREGQIEGSQRGPACKGSGCADKAGHARTQKPLTEGAGKGTHNENGEGQRAP